MSNPLILSARLLMGEILSKFFCGWTSKSMMFLLAVNFSILFYFLVTDVEERPWWPTQSPNNGRKKKAKGYKEGDQIKFIDLRFKRWQVVRFRKAR